MTLSLHGVKLVPRLPSPHLLSSPSVISYSQGNSLLGIRAYGIVHSQLPLLLFHVASRKSQIVHFSGERHMETFKAMNEILDVVLRDLI